jgi:hypothetical protein
MKRLVRLGEWIGDRVNPIAVKELRQSVQSRLIPVGLVVYLIVNALILILAVMNSSYDETSFSGEGAFFGLLGVLFVGVIFIVPFQAGMRMASERNNTNVDLFFFTAMGPHKIIRGKFIATMILVGMLVSAALPYLTFTYLLRGVDMPTILLSIYQILLVSALVTMGAINLSCLTGNRLLQIILYVLGGFFLLGGIDAADEIVEKILRADSWGRVLAWETGIVLWCLMLQYLLSAALIGIPGSNRALPLRVFVTASFFGGVILAYALYFHYHEDLFIMLWFLGAAVLLGLSLLVAIGEPDETSRRIRAQVPRTRFSQWGAFLVYTGCPGGLLWILLLSMIAFGVAFRFVGSSAYSREEYKFILGTLYLGLFLWGGAMFSIFLHGLLFRHASPILRPLVAILSLVALMLAPLIFAALHGVSMYSLQRGKYSPLWVAISPVMVLDGGWLFGSTSKSVVAWAMAVLWSGLTTVFALPFLWHSAGTFQPLPRKPQIASPPVPYV